VTTAPGNLLLRPSAASATVQLHAEREQQLFMFLQMIKHCIWAGSVMAQPNWLVWPDPIQKEKKKYSSLMLAHLFPWAEPGIF
jgi:hypothetical protein